MDPKSKYRYLITRSDFERVKTHKMHIVEKQNRVILKNFLPISGGNKKNHVNTGCKKHSFEGIVRNYNLKSPEEIAA